MLLEWNYKKMRLKQQKRLSPTNLSLYKSITSYIQNSNLRGVEKEEILQQVMDMMLQAQMEGKGVELFIGRDYQKFCKAVIEEYTNSKNRPYRILSYVQKYLIWMSLITLFLGSLNGVITNFSDFGITLGQFITISIFSLILIPVARKTQQENIPTPLFAIGKRIFTIYRNLEELSLYALFASMMVVLGVRFVVGQIWGKEIFNYFIDVYSNIPYFFIVFLMVGAVEGYKRVCDKK